MNDYIFFRGHWGRWGQRGHWGRYCLKSGIDGSEGTKFKGCVAEGNDKMDSTIIKINSDLPSGVASAQHELQVNLS
ncbi:MAG: hypothetical protein LBB88_01690 [Planctomycetaceae bacterium]|nr:hypothetical protein [Planctomycetaceae bacterium]